MGDVFERDANKNNSARDVIEVERKGNIVVKRARTLPSVSGAVAASSSCSGWDAEEF